mgnify:FL=1
MVPIKPTPLPTKVGRVRRYWLACKSLNNPPLLFNVNINIRVVLISINGYKIMVRFLPPPAKASGKTIIINTTSNNNNTTLFYS